MDPTELLNQIRELAKKVIDDDNSTPEADDIASKILDLDHWMSTGGFLPEQWA